MAGLLLLGAIAVWCGVCLKIAAYISKKVPSGWVRRLASLVLPPVIFVLPISNHIVGWLQFEHLCQEANHVTFLGVLPAPKELYSASGEWLLGKKMDPSQFKEHGDLVALADSLVQWDSGYYTSVSDWTFIGKRTTTISGKPSGGLVAQWTSYSFSGGLGRLMGVTRECRPDLLNQDGYKLYEKIFVLR